MRKGWAGCHGSSSTARGNPLRKNNFGRRVFQRLLKKAGVRPIKFHALRHTFASAQHTKSMRGHYAYIAYPRFGAKPATEVTRADVRDLIVAISAQGKSRSVARNLLAPVQQTFNQLIDDGLMTANPAARMGRYLKDKKDRRAGLELLTPEEEEVLLTAALTHASRYYCLLLCALRTGLRIGELFGLQWDDLDFSGRFIEVRRTLKDGRRVFAPKNGKIRRVDSRICSDCTLPALDGSDCAHSNRAPWRLRDDLSALGNGNAGSA